MQAPSGPQKLSDPATRALLELLCERWHTARRLIARHSFDAPHRKEQVRQTDKGLVARYGSRPVIKSIQIETAQEYASRVDFVEHAPALFARAVQDNDDRRSRFNPYAAFRGHLRFFFAHPSRICSQARLDGQQPA